MRLFLILVLIFAVVFSNGCKKKQQTLSDSQVPLSIEMIPTTNITNLSLPMLAVNESIAVSSVAPAALSEVPIPQGPYKPTGQQIQTALKNAGFYGAEIDGKIGPKSKKAIEEFQKANNLQVDGKVGPKTWAVLSKYLNSPSLSPAGTEKKP
ncbi:MAG: peptidoglycan-binding protein [Candidatus Omnitrophica bacterium]|nr:peptidoglycan-binding protein [Candidatus Omnitrophota bacterium]